MQKIDGSAGEGGGQILRTALSVSCVLGEAVRISGIRAGRENGGLRPQHLSACSLLAKITGANVEGAAIGSREMVFEPGKIIGGEYSLDIGTAGACTLLLQAALPVLAFAKSESTLVVKGGTHVRGAPTFEYFSSVFLPAARKWGVDADARLVRAGFYPKGGGEIVLRVKPSPLSGASLERQWGKPASYSILSCGIPPHVAEREKAEISGMLQGLAPIGEAKSVAAACPGNAVTVWGGFFGASALGERGKPASAVAREACGIFLEDAASSASVDSRLADQLLIYAALAGGKSHYCALRHSQHLTTNAEILAQMTGRDIILSGGTGIEVAGKR